MRHCPPVPFVPGAKGHTKCGVVLDDVDVSTVWTPKWCVFYMIVVFDEYMAKCLDRIITTQLASETTLSTSELLTASILDKTVEDLFGDSPPSSIDALAA
jgi:hypothetical protein